ncbi:MAG TPA: PAS domain-containing sensor histidine kinase [Candidatus Binataceae bacterium]|nr:PAS domain-containing sensor histidine kinase [Candidatus Binataceae bacterium]
MKALEDSDHRPTAELGTLVSLLSAIVDSSEDAIVSKTLDGIITSWNRGAEKIFGYTAAEAIGQSIRIIIPPERQSEEDYVLGQLRLGHKVEHFETVRLTKDGRRLDISLTVSPVKDPNGRVVGASKIARDITEKKQIDLERELARQQLLDAISARDDFIAIAAHELRNPLNVLLLIWRLLDRTVRPGNSDQVKNLLDKSRVQLERLGALIDRLLDVARVQAGTFEMYLERFDLIGLIREVVNRFAVENSATSISLELEPQIEGTWDRLRLDQVFTNLISNAVKYGAGKPIEVRASSVGNQVLVSIKDHGAGISGEDLPRIFDRFGRGAASSADRGLGMGLWITRQIVEAHGGTVVADSTIGKGSSFSVRLPLQPE